jgi:DNA-binding Xre family transcriptional regulator
VRLKGILIHKNKKNNNFFNIVELLKNDILKKLNKSQINNNYITHLCSKLLCQPKAALLKDGSLRNFVSFFRLSSYFFLERYFNEQNKKIETTIPLIFFFGTSISIIRTKKILKKFVVIVFYFYFFFILGIKKPFQRTQSFVFTI